MRIDVDTNHGQVADSIENYYGATTSLPPDGHPNSRICPQCEQATWSMTQHCLCCGVDLFALDEHVRWRAMERRKMMFAAGFAALAFVAMWAREYLPPPVQGWAFSVGVIFGVLSLAAMRV